MPSCQMKNNYYTRDPDWPVLGRFYRATRMHSADYAVARCPSVRPLHTRIETAKDIITLCTFTTCIPCRTLSQYSDDDPLPPPVMASNAVGLGCGYNRSHIAYYILGQMEDKKSNVFLLFYMCHLAIGLDSNKTSKVCFCINTCCFPIRFFVSLYYVA